MIVTETHKYQDCLYTCFNPASKAKLQCFLRSCKFGYCLLVSVFLSSPWTLKVSFCVHKHISATTLHLKYLTWTVLFSTTHNKSLTYVRILDSSNKQLGDGRRLLTETEQRETQSMLKGMIFKAWQCKIVLASITVIIFVVVMGNGLFCMLPNKNTL